MKIVEMTKDQYQDFKVSLDYESDYYYKVVIDETDDRHTISFIKNNFLYLAYMIFFIRLTFYFIQLAFVKAFKKLFSFGPR